MELVLRLPVRKAAGKPDVGGVSDLQAELDVYLLTAVPRRHRRR